ncbi:DNA helicase RecQ [Halobacteriovorax marinus]|uniref:DNA helicase RecQ n=1 Tax=Halobacteriovorax marinus TaxID=97084 RepID=UPI000BDE672D|nr:DNA helicase RecQ [Halobacteriovorax marinus]
MLIYLPMRDKQIHQILKDKFGHKSFRLSQLDIVNSILDGHDTMAIMPTGGGKSICYQVPALYLEGITLVVSPLISLMSDQVSNLAANGIHAVYLNSNQSPEQRQEAISDIRSKRAKLVYISPEGILSGGNSSLLESIDISLIAIDEAHCVSQWGHEFRPDYTRLGLLKELFPSTPLMALTATADEKTRRDIAYQLKMEEPNIYISSFDRSNIKYSILEREDEIKQLDEFISKNHAGDTGIVYCLSRKKVESVSKKLKERGHHSFAYHAGLSANERDFVQKAFNNDDGIIIVATVAFGMGIDRPDVRFVAHLDLPKSVESYYQETGRAGRDGQAANAWMVYGLQDVIKHSHMLETTEASEHYKKVAREKLDSMLSICETTKCRRNFLLQYFEEESSPKCDNCDSCLHPGDVWDARVDAQKLLSTIFRTGQRYGANYIVDVLRGSKNSKVEERGHHNLSVYGIGKDETKSHWNLIVRQLLNMKYIAISNWEYRTLALMKKSEALLKGEEEFLLKKRKITLRKSAPTENQNHQRDDLFNNLRKIRKSIANENGLAPFMIFGDKTLHDMCHLLPRDKSEFLMVNGVGTNKCERYGDDFLKEINSYIQRN